MAWESDKIEHKTFYFNEAVPMSVTIKDVARVANVSISTVSNVLNGKRKSFNAETYERVMQAVQQLGYHPNRAARSLVTKATRVLGFCFGANTKTLYKSSYLVELLDGVMNVAEEAGYNIMLYTRLDYNADDRYTDSFLDQSIDGLVIVAPAPNNPLPAKLAAMGLPIILIGMDDPDSRLAYIDVDNVQGAKLALQHLWDMGHRRIAHIGGQEIQRSAQQRANTYRQFMADRNEPIPAGWEQWTHFNYETGKLAAQKILASPEIPTAIFAANDHIALGVIDAANERGLCVPEDLSVVGFDDIREAEMANPAITTIRQPIRDISVKATLWLLENMDPFHLPLLQELVPPELIERQSVASPRSR